MEHILHQLPMIYIYWACFLTVWSVVCGGMLMKAIAHSRNRVYTDQTNLIILFTVAIGGATLAASVFLIPQVTILFIEIALMLSLWYTVFLASISHLNIMACLRRPITQMFATK